MKKHYLITGGPNTGKSHLAKLIVGDRKTVVLNGYMFNSPFAFSQCTHDTEFIVIDDVDKYLVDIIKTALCDTIKVNKPYEDGFEISPKFIILTNNKTEINQFLKYNFFIYEAK